MHLSNYNAVINICCVCNLIMHKDKYRSRELGSECLMMVIHPFSNCLPSYLPAVGALVPPCLLAAEPDLFRLPFLASLNDLAVDHHTSHFQSSLINTHSLALQLCWCESLLKGFRYCWQDGGASLCDVWPCDSFILLGFKRNKAEPPDLRIGGEVKRIRWRKTHSSDNIFCSII